MNLRKKPVYLYDSDPAKKKSASKPFWKKREAPEPPETSPALREEAKAVSDLPNSTPISTPATEKAVKKKKEKKPRKEKPPKAQKERAPKQPGRFRPSKRSVLGGISIVCALLVAFVLSPLVTRMANEESGEVLRARQMIPKGSQLDASLFEVVEVPARGISKNTVSPSESIEGKYAAVDIPAEDMLLTAKVSDRIPFPDEYLYTLPEGKQAMSVRIQGFESGLSGKLRKDDVVSVYASLKNEKEDYLAVAPPELRYVPVLSVTTETGADYDKQSGAQAKTEDLPVTVELLVGERQAQALAGLNHSGSIHLALVSRGNPEYAGQLLADQEKMLAVLIQEAELAAKEESPEAEDHTEVEAIE